LLEVAWDLMTPEQKVAFRGHPDILAIEDAVGGGSGAAKHARGGSLDRIYHSPACPVAGRPVSPPLLAVPGKRP
jgi:hypothetical protein